MAYNKDKILQEIKDCLPKEESDNSRNSMGVKESFKIKEIIPTSDHSATVIMQKNTGKLAAFLFYYINRGASKGWKYFIPTDSHVSGFRAFEHYKMNVERHNYKHNF